MVTPIYREDARGNPVSKLITCDECGNRICGKCDFNCPHCRKLTEAGKERQKNHFLGFMVTVMFIVCGILWYFTVA